MTVRECIELGRRRPKVTRLWLCPHIVNDPKVGKEYVFETSINTKQLTESLLNTEVRKHWIENQDTLCVVYTYDQNGVNVFIDSNESTIIDAALLE